MTKRYPFKFLDAYNKADTDIFFGRDEEVEALYQMAFQSDILLVYGASGTGKTSLINCGLASRFQAHDWLALNIRRGSDINLSLQQKLDEATAGAKGADSDLDLSWLDEEEEATTGSPLSRQIQDIYRRYFRPVYLIFDQFEELYVLGSKAEQARFIQSVQEIQSVGQPVKMIFVIREEYLGHLFEFERAVPQLLRKKLRVEPMNLDKVGQVIRGAAALEGSNIRLAAGQEDVIVEGIFQKIRGDAHTLAIQLPYLQVFLDKLYLHVTGDEARQADALFTPQALAEIGDIGDVLRDFLEEQAVRIQKALAGQYPGLPEDAVWQILSPLATLEGTKEPMLEETLLQRLAHLPAAAVRDGLQALDQSRILRYDENESRYEVAHDSLAARIAEHRNDDEIAMLEIRRLITSQMALKAEARALFTERQLNLIEPYVDKLALEPEAVQLIEDSRKEVAAAARRKAIMVSALAIIAVGAIAASVVAIFFSFQAKAQTRLAEEKRIEADSSAAEATRAFLAAQIAREAAQDSAQVALEQRQKAEENAQQASAARDEAQAALDRLEEANTKVARNLLENVEKDIGELRYEAALEKIKAAAALNVLKEEAAKAYLKLVHTLMRKREYEAAVEKIKAAPAFNVSKEEAAKAYLELVHTLILEREYEAAVEKIKAAPAFIVSKEEAAKAYLELVHTLIRRLEYEAAVEKIKAATAFNVSKEEAAKAYLELAFWFGETGQPERAVDLLNSAAQLVNSRAVAARLQSLPRDTAAARQKLRDAIQLFDKNTFNTLWARYYPVMVVVEGGTFQMGSASGYDEKLHPATVSNFQIAKYETTWWQYGLFCQATGKDYKSPYGGMDGDNPVVNVVWYDAVAYASWLSRHMGYKKATSRDADGWENVIDLKANGYRLPTEAEWEYAARQRGQKVRFGNGKDIADPEEINFDGSAQDKKPYSKEGVYRRRTTEVGSFVPNSLGLYDMSGNVWEWCWDWFGEYPDNPPVDYTGPLDGFGRVMRGGAFDSSPDNLICSHRSGGNIFRRYSYVGFRLARSME